MKPPGMPKPPLPAPPTAGNISSLTPLLINSSLTRNSAQSSSNSLVNEETYQAMAQLKDGVLKNKRFMKLTMYSLECAGRMIVDDSAADAFIDSGCMDAFMLVLKDNPNNHDLRHLLNCVLLKAASRSKDTALRIVEALGDNVKLLFQNIEGENSEAKTNAEASASSLFAALMLASRPVDDNAPQSKSKVPEVTRSAFARTVLRLGTWGEVVRSLEAKLTDLTDPENSEQLYSSITRDSALCSILGAFSLGLSDITLAEAIVQNQHQINSAKQKRLGVVDLVLRFAELVSKVEDKHYSEIHHLDNSSTIVSPVATSSSSYRTLQRALAVTADRMKAQHVNLSPTNTIEAESFEYISAVTSTVVVNLLQAVASAGARLLDQSGQSGSSTSTFVVSTLPLSEYIAGILKPDTLEFIVGVNESKSNSDKASNFFNPKALLSCATPGANVLTYLVDQSERILNPMQTGKIIEALKSVCSQLDTKTFLAYVLSPQMSPPPAHLVPFDSMSISAFSDVNATFTRAQSIAIIRQLAAMALVDKLQSTIISSNGIDAVFQLTRRMSSFTEYQKELSQAGLRPEDIPVARIASLTPLLSKEYALTLLTSEQVRGFTSAVQTVIRCSGLFHGSTVNRAHNSYLMIDFADNSETSLLVGNFKSLSLDTRSTRVYHMIEPASKIVMRSLSLILFDLLVLQDAVITGCERISRKAQIFYTQTTSSGDVQASKSLLAEVAQSMHHVLPLLALISERLETCSTSIVAAFSLITRIDFLKFLNSTDVLLYIQQILEVTAVLQRNVLFTLNVLMLLCPPHFNKSVLFQATLDDSIFWKDCELQREVCAGIEVDSFFIACTGVTRSVAKLVGQSTLLVFPSSVASHSSDAHLQESAQLDSNALTELGEHYTPILESLASISMRVIEIETCDTQMQAAGFLEASQMSENNFSNLFGGDKSNYLADSFRPLSRPMCSLLQLLNIKLGVNSSVIASDPPSTFAFVLPILNRILTSAPHIIALMSNVRDRFRERSSVALQVPTELRSVELPILLRTARCSVFDPLPSVCTAAEYLETSNAEKIQKEAVQIVNEPILLTVSSLVTFLESVCSVWKVSHGKSPYMEEAFVLASSSIQSLLAARQDGSINTFLAPASSLGIDSASRMRQVELIVAAQASNGQGLNPLFIPTNGQVARLRAIFEEFARNSTNGVSPTPFSKSHLSSSICSVKDTLEALYESSLGNNSASLPAFNSSLGVGPRCAVIEEWSDRVQLDGSISSNPAHYIRQITKRKSQISSLRPTNAVDDPSALMPSPLILSYHQESIQDSSQKAKLASLKPTPHNSLFESLGSSFETELLSDDSVAFEMMSVKGMVAPLQAEDLSLDSISKFAVTFANSLPNLSFESTNNKPFANASPLSSQQPSAIMMVNLLNNVNDLVSNLCTNLTSGSFTTSSAEKLRNGFTRLLGLFDSFAAHKPSHDRSRGLMAICTAFESVLEVAEYSAKEADFAGFSPLSIVKGEMKNALFAFGMLKRLASVIDREAELLSKSPLQSDFIDITAELGDFPTYSFLSTIFPALQVKLSPPSFDEQVAEKAWSISMVRGETERDASLVRFVARMLHMIPLFEALSTPESSPLNKIPRRLGRNRESAPEISSSQWSSFVSFVQDTERRVLFASTKSSARLKGVQSPPSVPQGFQFTGALAQIVAVVEEKTNLGTPNGTSTMEEEFFKAYGARCFDQLADRARAEFQRETKRRQIQISYLLHKLWNISDVMADTRLFAKMLNRNAEQYEIKAKADEMVLAEARAQQMNSSLEAARALQKDAEEQIERKRLEEQRIRNDEALIRLHEAKAQREREQALARIQTQDEIEMLRKQLQAKSVPTRAERKPLINVDDSSAMGKVEDVLPKETLQFLTTGGILSKHGRKGNVSRRVVYLSLANPQSIVWRETNLLQPKPSQVMKLSRFVGIEAGLACEELRKPGFKGFGTEFALTETAAVKEHLDHTNGVDSTQNISGVGKAPLLRLPTKARINAMPLPLPLPVPSTTSSPAPVPEIGAACFAIMGTDLEGKYRELGFECADAISAKLWVHHLKVLSNYCSQAQRPFEDDTELHHSNILYEDRPAVNRLPSNSELLRQISKKSSKEDDDEDDIVLVRAALPQPLPPSVSSPYNVHAVKQAESKSIPFDEPSEDDLPPPPPPRPTIMKELNEEKELPTTQITSSTGPHSSERLAVPLNSPIPDATYGYDKDRNVDEEGDGEDPPPPPANSPLQVLTSTQTGATYDKNYGAEKIPEVGLDGHSTLPGKSSNEYPLQPPQVVNVPPVSPAVLNRPLPIPTLPAPPTPLHPQPQPQPKAETSSIHPEQSVAEKFETPNVVSLPPSQKSNITETEQPNISKQRGVPSALSGVKAAKFVLRSPVNRTMPVLRKPSEEPEKTVWSSVSTNAVGATLGSSPNTATKTLCATASATSPNSSSSYQAISQENNDSEVHVESYDVTRDGKPDLQLASTLLITDVLPPPPAPDME